MTLLSQSSPLHDSFPFPGCQFVRHKKRQIANIADWIQVFTVYVAAMSTKYPEATLALLAYQLTIIKVNQQYDGLYWQGRRQRYGRYGTAMAVPVFEGEKWCRLDSNLTCVIECPLRALRRSLGRLRGL